MVQYHTRFKEAAKTPEWVRAMNEEIRALKSNQTWSLVPLPLNKKAIGCKWVYKTKFTPTGEIDKLKARLVAQMISLRILLALGTSKSWHFS